MESFSTETTINVYTPGWDPVAALADAHNSNTTIVWANPPQAEIGDVFEYEGLYYKILSETTVEVTVHPDRTDDDGIYAGNITVPETAIFGTAEYDVVGIGDESFDHCESLGSVNISEGVTYIGNSSFNWCSVTSISMPSSMTSIGSCAFQTCSALTSVIIPEGVTSMGDWTFAYCSNLASVTIPGTLTAISDYAFYVCQNLTTVNFAETLESIGNFSFNYCTKLASIDIPDSTTYLGNGAFSNCSNLSSVNIPDGVTSISSSLFYGCSKLASIDIPDSVTSIGSAAFKNCSGLGSITFPSSVTSIDFEAFNGCSSLETVVFEYAYVPQFDIDSFNTGTTTNVYTEGWDPVAALANAHDSSTTIVWANPPYSDLVFTSNPIADGVYAYVGPKVQATN